MEGILIVWGAIVASLFVFYIIGVILKGDWDV